MNAFKNHTNTVAPARALSAHQVIACLASELVAADQVLNALHHYSPIAPLLHAMADLQGRGVIDQDLLRNPERKAVLDLVKQYRAQARAVVSPVAADSQDLVRRLRTVAGQSVIKPPALDLEAADCIERLVAAIAGEPA